MVREIGLPDGVLDKKVNIALVQLQSPFFEKLDYCMLDLGDYIFDWKNISQYPKKINNILTELSYIKEYKPDIVVFPEYSVPHSLVNEIQNKFSKQFKIIVAGSDQIRNDEENNLYKKNVCPVIVGSEVYLIEKYNLFEGEKNVVKSGSKDKSVLKLNWKADGEQLSICICICFDYLYVDSHVGDVSKSLYITPMCSDNMKKFSDNVSSKIYNENAILFCNTITLNKDNQLKHVGGSAIYGANHAPKYTDFNIIEKIDKEEEGVILTSLNLHQLFITKGPARPKSVKPYEYSAKFYFDINYKLIKVKDWTKSPETTILPPIVQVTKETKSVLNEIQTYIEETTRLKDNKIELPFSMHPDILVHVISKNKYNFKATAYVDKDEHFWDGSWGKKVSEAASKHHERIFIVQSKDQLYKLKNTLNDHSRKYNVFAISQDNIPFDIQYRRDYSITNDTTIGTYKLDKEGDPIIDKKIVYEEEPYNLDSYIDDYEKLKEMSVRYNYEDYNTNEIFDKFVSKVFNTNELSNYIDISTYNENEEFHPYYKEMHAKIIEQIENDVNKISKLGYWLTLKILEIGPGTGILTKKYACKKYCSEDGRSRLKIDLIEKDGQCFKFLEKKLEREIFFSKLYHDDFLEHEFNNEKYDLIITSFSNHHIEPSKVKKFYKKIYDLLENDGKFIFGEEYLPEYNEKDEESYKKALYTYHIHIISTAINNGLENKEDGYFKLAELENISLNQGIKGEGEYKVSLAIAERDLNNAKLKCTFSKIGPSDVSIGGVYCCIAKKG